MTGSDLPSMYEFSDMAANRSLDGVSHEDSLVVPQRSGISGQGSVAVVDIRILK